jgi:hypothetical protein
MAVPYKVSSAWIHVMKCLHSEGVIGWAAFVASRYFGVYRGC